MSKSFRIRTTPGEDDGYLKVNVDLKQNFDFLELLSLKITQVDEYQSFCSDYGVIAGRIDVNNGFGIPNVKVSIFIPIEESDLDNPVISGIYPYTDPNPAEKNDKGIRYNLLPKTQQSLDHTPVGTFPEKREILDSNTTLEIYEKYYKYTTTTNKAGDFILFGIPVGQHTLHYDVDFSDIGFLSQRPFELISQGYSEDLFDSRFKFKSSNNLSKLPQIISANIEINVEPYWCDSLSEGRQLGINRKDISIDEVEIIPTAIFLGSMITDDEKDSVNKNCRPDRDMGKMKEMITNSGKMQAIRRTVDGTIENFSINGDAIDENGNWSIQLPMNIRKVITNEFGELIPSPDGIKGVATEGDYRFKISMDQSDTDKRLRQRAKFIVPNLHNNYHFKTYGYDELKKSDHFHINDQLSNITVGTQYSGDTTNQYNYLEEFYSFRWKKVYTVKQYIGRFQKTPDDEGRSFIGIKDISNGEGVNKFPSNRADTTVHPLYTLLCILMTFIGTLVAIINGVIMFVNGLVTMICNIRVPTSLRLSYCFRVGGCGTCSQAYKDKCCSTYSSNSHPCKDSDVGETTGICSGSVPGNCSPGCGIACGKCRCNGSGTGEAEFGIELGWKCILAGLCNKCKDYCGDQHSCCRNETNACATCTPCNYNTCSSCNKPAWYTDVSTGPPSNVSCCSKCCLKIPLIKLKCAEDETFIFQHTLFKTPFASNVCNETYLGDPILCLTCGGPQIKGIKDWVSCLLEPVAVWLNMLKFDFYNDWVGGTLYFPLIKRKYKVKKRKRKFGQIKKDKFCHFHCREIDSSATLAGIGNWLSGTGPIPEITSSIFQGNDNGYIVDRIRIEKPTYTSPLITSSGCKFTLGSDIATKWYGTQATTQSQNLDNAAKEIELKGKNDNEEPCVIRFTTYPALQSFFNSYPSINIVAEDTTKIGIYGKPEYVLTEDPFGQDSWVNVGGYGLQKNKCNLTYMVEREEYFKPELDCPGTYVAETYTPVEDISMPPSDTGEISPNTGAGNLSCLGDPFTCLPKCGTNGVKACNAFCPCSVFTGGGSGVLPDIADYKTMISHGLITWFNQEIYYTPTIPAARHGEPSDDKWHPDEYKANLMLPTTIMELGSSTFCDIDDVPFIMNELPPTTYGVSYEAIKYKTTTSDNVNFTVDKFKDKEGSINLSAYVEFGCVATVCFNSVATVNGSQIGVESIDKNDIGIEVTTCFMRFIHDIEVREYFCRRFNGYKNKNLDVHYQKPGSNIFENDYQTYPDMTLLEQPQKIYTFPNQGNQVKVSEYNDNDAFVPGDGCGFYSYNSNWIKIGSITPDWFYGLAPGHTMTLINFPNEQNQTIDFGQTTHTAGVDLVGDGFNGHISARGIKFSRSQTPYYLYFGLIGGKTALHKTVGKFFADKINAVTLQGIGESDNSTSENFNNQNNINNTVTNPYSIYRTCLGQTQQT